MDLASAYPNSAVTAGALMLLGFVMAGSLALWLGLVFLADRKSREPGTEEAAGASGYLAVVAQPRTADDGHSGGAANAAADRPGVAA